MTGSARRSGESSFDRLIEGYWRHQRAFDAHDEALVDRYQWAWNEVDELVRERSPNRLELLVALAESAVSDWDLESLGAGHVEDLVRSVRSSDELGQLVAAAKRSGKFRNALRSVWLGEGTPMELVPGLQMLISGDLP